RPTVIGELGEAVPERVFPAGRLDMDSQGLIFLTNDGWIANRIMHPRYGCNKTYKVLIGGVPSEHALERWRSGENLYMDGQPLAPCGVEILEVMDDRTWLIVILGEGKKRQIRRTAEIFRHTVIELIRTHIGPIELGDLPYGAWRDLTPEEVETLRENFLKVSDPDEEDSMPEIAVNLEDDDESQ
ncbi:MAG TPA: pseudouridine synthase, partial [Aggregatilineales bacterium]|nr:pseudouridine synthase [Aggregatilineales bacterium]